MATPKVVCGNCGTAIGIHETTCPHCGESVSWDPVRCTVCGFENVAGSTTCTSCGAQVGKSVPAPKSQAKPKPGKKTPAQQQRMFPRLQAWHLVAIVAGAGVIALVLYLEFGSKNIPLSHPPSSGPTMQIAPKIIDLKPLQAAVDANPKDPVSHLHLANAQQDAGEYREALQTYTRYLLMRPQDPDARVDLGVCYFELGRRDSLTGPTMFAEAIKQMETVAKKDKNHQPAAYNLGVVYLAVGDMATARKWFTAAVTINKESDLGKRAQNLLTQHTF